MKNFMRYGEREDKAGRKEDVGYGELGGDKQGRQ